jgi:HD superfamily phosphohydrolases
MKPDYIDSLFAESAMYITDPLWKDIPLPGPFAELVLSASFQKLNRIKQNGPAYHVYPGAVHTRYSHSLGVYYLSSQILHTLTLSGHAPFTKRGMASFLAASLLHDLGHFPYAHSLKELAIREHEELASEIIGSDDEILTALDKIGADAEMVSAIIDTERAANDDETQIYRRILSGTLDPDKLDYLNRDAFFSGVPYGSQETERVIRSLVYCDGEILIKPSASPCVEHLLFSKYLMYKNVYWHKYVRSATAMVKKALLEAIGEKVIREEDLYFLDDEQFATLPDKHPDFTPFELISDERNGKLCSCPFEKDYEKNGPLEKAASDIYKRREAEERLYKALSAHNSGLKPHQVIIDVPEPIKFESDISILTENGKARFDEVDPLFSKDIKNLFAKSLRKVRIFTPQSVSGKEIREAVENVF